MNVYTCALQSVLDAYTERNQPFAFVSGAFTIEIAGFRFFSSCCLWNSQSESTCVRTRVCVHLSVRDSILIWLLSSRSFLLMSSTNLKFSYQKEIWILLWSNSEKAKLTDELCHQLNIVFYEPLQGTPSKADVRQECWSSELSFSSLLFEHIYFIGFCESVIQHIRVQRQKESRTTVQGK